MTPYRERFKEGSVVRIAAAEALRDFQRCWKLHHPLTDDQVAFAEQQTRVSSVGFYHGGDVLYQLSGAPGIWHEQCLEGVTDGIA